MKRFWHIGGLVVFSAWLVHPLFAGLHIKTDTTYFTPSKGDREGRILIENPQVLMELAASEFGDKGSIIFHADKKSLMNFHHKSKTYGIMDEAGLAAVKREVMAMRAKMKKQLQALPEARQKKMRAILEKGVLAPMGVDEPEPTVIRSEGEVQLDGMACVRYNVFKSDRKVGEVWAVHWDKVGVAKKDLDAFYKLVEFQQELAGSLPGRQSLAEGLDAFKYIDGFPLQIKRFVNGELKHVTKLRLVGQESIPSAVFEPPSDYEKRVALMRSEEGRAPGFLRGELP